MKRSIFMIVIIGCLLLFPLMAFAQDAEIDPLGFVSVIFSPAIAAAVGIIVGFTKMIRNMINLKGPLAVGLTFLVSVGYGFIQYSSQGIGFALAVGVIAGAASVAGFWLTKQFGKKANPVGTK